MSALAPKKAVLKDLKILDDELAELDVDNDSFLDWFKTLNIWVFRYGSTIQKLIVFYKSTLNYDQWSDVFTSLELPCNRLGRHVACRWMEDGKFNDIDDIRTLLWYKMLDHMDITDLITDKSNELTPISLLKTSDSYANVTFKLRFLNCRTHPLDFECLIGIDWTILNIKYLIMDRIKISDVDKILIFMGRTLEKENILDNHESLSSKGITGGPEMLPVDVTMYYDYEIKTTQSLLVHKQARRIYPIHNRFRAKLAQYSKLSK